MLQFRHCSTVERTATKQFAAHAVLLYYYESYTGFNRKFGPVPLMGAGINGVTQKVDEAEIVGQDPNGTYSV